MKISKNLSIETSSRLVWVLTSLLLVFFSDSNAHASLHNTLGDDPAVPMTWHLCQASNHSSKQQQEGEWLSKLGAFYRTDCMPARVPGTVLSILIDNGIYCNNSHSTDDSCYYETNLQSIPDMYETGAAPWTFYYVANFTLPQNEHKKNTWLELRSINYQAELWLDGSKVVGHPVQGMFQRFSFPLGRLAQDETHHLAILVQPPPHPGKPGGGQGGSTHSLAQDGPVSQFTAGWDWIQATPDRNTGLWDKVTLKQTGQIQLRDPFVKVSNIRIDQHHHHHRADLEFEVSIDCHDEDFFHSQESITMIQLEYHVQNTNGAVGTERARFSTRHVQLNPKQVCGGATTLVAKFPKERLNDAQLWYPHTHGTPTLYQATMRVGTVPAIHNATGDWEDSILIDNDDLHWDDQVSFSFGIRKVEFTVHPKLNGLQALVNEKRVFLQGGNWIATDQFMRFIGTKARYQAEIALHRAMGFNMIRVWGGGITERPEFFDVCDQLGILVLSDLWMSGDNNGRWAGSYLWPTNHLLYLHAVRDTFLLLRNHPSLAMYSAGNELYPTTKNPPPDILSGIRRALQEIDPNTFLIASTMTNWTDFNPQDSLCPKDGPYGVMEEAFYYERNPGLYDWKNHEHYRLLEFPIAFQPEIGSASFPTMASLSRFMSAESLNAIPGYQDSNVHPTWEYHNFLGFTSNRNPYAKNPKNNLKVDLIH